MRKILVLTYNVDLAVVLNKKNSDVYSSFFYKILVLFLAKSIDFVYIFLGGNNYGGKDTKMGKFCGIRIPSVVLKTLDLEINDILDLNLNENEKSIIIFS